MVPLGLMDVGELLGEEVPALAGERYARKLAAGRRTPARPQPGDGGTSGQRVPIRVPRLRHVAGSEIPLRSYEALQVATRSTAPAGEARAVWDLVPQLRSGRRGDVLRGSIGLSGSTVSRTFIGRVPRSWRVPRAGLVRSRTW